MAAKREKNRNPVGRPMKFQSVEELERKIEEYFDSCYEEVWYKEKDEQTGGERWVPVYDRYGEIKKQLARPFTITGLALHLGTTRRTLLDYEERNDEFSHTIKKAKLRIENFYEEQLSINKNTAGIIFNMVNNYGWVNRQDNNVTAKVNMTYEEQLAELVSDD